MKARKNAVFSARQKKFIQKNFKAEKAAIEVKRAFILHFGYTRKWKDMDPAKFRAEYEKYLRGIIHELSFIRNAVTG